MFRLKMYPANNGDAFLVDAGGTYILIDAGFASTYQDFIATDLAQLAKDGSRLDLVVCTHIDADHIGGLLEFLSLNGTPAKRGIEVDAVWHNSLRSLPASTATPDSVHDRMVLEAMRRRGFQGVATSSFNPISARQGSSLAKLLRQYGYSWNSGDGTSCISQGGAPVPLPRNVGVHVIGPKTARLEGLRDLWLREVRKLGYRGSSQPSDLIDDAYEMWCATAPPPPVPHATPIAANNSLRLADVYTPDPSIPNGSSIALIILTGNTRLLFLGDAWAEDVVDSLKALEPTAAPIIFDAIKVSHHGSLHNTSVELLSIADSPCFLISSDGSRHGHPDFEVLAEIVDRPASFKRHLYFNYGTAASKQLESHTSKSGTAFSVHVAKNDWIQVGENNYD
ncbi:MAG: AVAST type 1 anti-phage system MBL fold metallo-hydrolase Avs1a [Polaromonas sp.]|uniref:AVAST type 1 anti-phage system MBL fold metallo-hydrolase Avs1a n=1 Tax=Polaromonas sp. TaxID=1869339 RepID=UPI002732B12E|nr:AVAST type 1 anti-phage system MBL fold metallo-hydrolase Avs1a [Polaromonas sp.]MDP3799787.1 AVAST type 1 anti-phage system MBL fold metallo-hydrolase Avs1a [Polaromonas sp.]